LQATSLKGARRKGTKNLRGNEFEKMGGKVGEYGARVRHIHRRKVLEIKKSKQEERTPQGERATGMTYVLALMCRGFYRGVILLAADIKRKKKCEGCVR